MTSRERVERVINFQQADRVPIDLGGMKASGIAVSAYNRLKAHLDLTSKTKVLDPRFMIAVIEEAIRQRFHIDVVPLDLDNALWWATSEKQEWIPKRLFDGSEVLFPPLTRIKEAEDGDWILLNPDGSPSSYRMPKGGFYFDDIAFDKACGKFDPQDFNPITTIPDENLKILARYGKHLYGDTELLDLFYLF